MAKKTANTKPRKKVVIEEVAPKPSEPVEVPREEASPNSQISDSAASDAVTTPAEGSGPLEVVKEKVTELKDVTEDIGESVQKSEEIQDEIIQAAEKVEPGMEPNIEDYAPPQPKKSGPSPLVILIPGVLLLGALLGGIYFYQKGINSETEATPTPEVAPETTVASSASPSAKLDLTKYPINVENGSGIPGTAGSAKDLLTKAGFKVSSTGNADNFDYTQTVIKVKSDVPTEFVTKLSDTLSKNYKVSSKTVDLPDSSKDEVIVIIGSSKVQN